MTILDGQPRFGFRPDDRSAEGQGELRDINVFRLFDGRRVNERVKMAEDGVKHIQMDLGQFLQSRSEVRNMLLLCLLAFLFHDRTNYERIAQLAE